MPSTVDPQLLTIELGDAADAWVSAGFEVSDGAVVLGSTAIVPTGRGGGFGGWDFDSVAPVELPGLLRLPSGDGVSRSTSGRHRPTDRPIAASTGHPNGISRIDHIVVMADDMDLAIEAFAAQGFRCRREHRTEVMGRPALQAFFWAGDVIIEVVGPPRHETRPHGQDDPGLSIFGLALVADDLVETAAHLGDRLGTVRPAVQPDRQIAGLRAKALGIELPIAVMSPHDKDAQTGR